MIITGYSTAKEESGKCDHVCAVHLVVRCRLGLFFFFI